MVRRRAYHGWNEFDINEEEPLWRKYISQVGGRYEEHRFSTSVWMPFFHEGLDAVFSTRVWTLFFHERLDAVFPPGAVCSAEVFVGVL